VQISEFNENEVNERYNRFKMRFVEPAAKDALGTRITQSKKNKLWTPWFNEEKYKLLKLRKFFI
jgi:hypothetical protein